MNDIFVKNNITKVKLEGLSFGSKSSSKDLVSASLWLIRILCFKRNIEFDIVAVTSWRNPLLSKEFNKEIKDMSYSDRKKALKEKIYSLLPDDVKLLFHEVM